MPRLPHRYVTVTKQECNLKRRSMNAMKIGHRNSRLNYCATLQREFGGTGGPFQYAEHFAAGENFLPMRANIRRSAARLIPFI